MRSSVASVALSVLVLGACGTSDGGAPADDARTGDTTSSSAAASTYSDVEDLRDAAIAAGFDCPAWTATGAGSGRCSSSSVLTVYGAGVDPRDAVNEAVDLLDQAGLGYAYLVGDNWSINTDDPAALQGELGGEVVAKDPDPPDRTASDCPLAAEVSSVLGVGEVEYETPEETDVGSYCNYLYPDAVSVILGVSTEGFEEVLARNQEFLLDDERLERLPNLGDEAFLVQSGTESPIQTLRIAIRDGDLVYVVGVQGVRVSRRAAVALVGLLRASDLRPD